MSNVTPSTAWTRATVRWRTPPLIGKCLTRSRTSTRAGRPGAASRDRAGGQGVVTAWARAGHVAGPRAGAAAGRPASWYSQQRTSWPGCHARRSSGWTSRARTTFSSTRAEQRGANRQPFGQVDEVGHVARDDRRAPRARRRRPGSTRSGPACTGGAVRGRGSRRRSARRSRRRTSRPPGRTSRRRPRGRG